MHIYSWAPMHDNMCLFDDNVLVVLFIVLVFTDSPAGKEGAGITMED